MNRNTIGLCICVVLCLGASPLYGPRDPETRAKLEAYRALLARIESLPREQLDLKALEAIAEEVQAKWPQRDVNSYGYLMVAVARAAYGNSNVHDDEDRYQLMRKYMLLALEKPGLFSLTTEQNLLDYLLSRHPGGEPEAVSKERTVDMGIWFRCRKRLLDAIDPSWDPSERIVLNPRPPAGTRGWSGMPPSAIADPALRAQYIAALEANANKIRRRNLQLEARRLRNGCPDAAAEAFVVRVYSELPANVEELKRYLEQYGWDAEVRERMIKQVEENVAKAKPRPRRAARTQSGPTVRGSAEDVMAALRRRRELELQAREPSATPRPRSIEEVEAALRRRRRGELEVDRPATSPSAPKVDLVRLQEKRSPSDTERLLAAVESLPARTLQGPEKQRAVELIKPWAVRVVAAKWLPDWKATDWKVISSPSLGDVFVGEYQAAGATIHLVDTATALAFEVKSPGITFPADGSEADRWVAEVGKYCGHAETIVKAPALHMWRAPNAVYVSPIYDQAILRDDAGWRSTCRSKLAKGYFCFSILKLIDGEHPADGTYGIRTRLQSYADVAAHLKKGELLGGIRSANRHELSVLLEHWDTAQATSAEVCESLVARGDIEPLELGTFLGQMQRHAGSAAEAVGLYDKLVQLANEGKVSAPAVVDAVKVLGRNGDNGEIRRSLERLKDGALKMRSLAQLRDGNREQE